MQRQTKNQKTLAQFQQQVKLIFQRDLQKARMQLLRQRRMQQCQQTFCESDSQQSQNEQQKQNFLQDLQESEQSSSFSHKRLFTEEQIEQEYLQKVKNSFNQNNRNSQKISLKFIHCFSELSIQNKLQNNKGLFQNLEQKSIQLHPSSLLNRLNISQSQNQKQKQKEQILFDRLNNFQQQKNLSESIQNNFNRINQKKQYEIPLTQLDKQESPICMKKTRNCKKDKIDKIQNQKLFEQEKQNKQNPLNFVYKLIIKIMNYISGSDKECDQTKKLNSLKKGIK